MERDAANAKWQRLHRAQQWHDGTGTSWAEQPSDAYPYHRDHGVTIGVAMTDLRPGDNFLTDEHAPFVPAPENPEEVSGGDTS